MNHICQKRKKKDTLQYKTKWASQVILLLNNLAANARDGQEDPLNEGRATHFSILADRGAWQAIIHGAGKESHNWSDLASVHAQNKIEGISIWYLADKMLMLFFIVVAFVIHWNESAMDLHVLPIPIPPPTSLSTQSL